MSRRSLQYRKRLARVGKEVLESAIVGAHKFVKSEGKARVFDKEKWQHLHYGIKGKTQCSLYISREKAKRLARIVAGAR